MEININNTNSKMFFDFKKNLCFEITIKKIIENITGIEDGLDAKSKNSIKKSCK